MKLDMKAPFGTVSGEDAARFEQSGRLFDADGNELTNAPEKGKPGRKPKEMDSAPVSDSAKPAIVDTAATDSAIDEQLAAQGL